VPGETVAGTPLPEQRSRDAARFSSAASRPALDRLAELARRLLGTASAQVSLLTEVQTVAGGAGLAPGAVGSTGPLADSLCTVTAAQRAPLAVDDAPRDGRVSHLPPVTGGAVGSYLGIPLTTLRGETVGALCVYGPEPRAWEDDDVEVLTQLSRSVIAELELAALSGEYQRTVDRWELAVDAAGVGSFDWDLVSGELLWDSRLLTLFGYGEHEFSRTIDDFNARVHPDDLARVSALLEEVLRTASPLDMEYRIVRPDGETRWIGARGRVLTDENGVATRVLGAAYDTTVVHEGESRVARVLESMSAAFIALDREWRFSYVNGEAERLLATSREQLLGGDIWELFPSRSGPTSRPTTAAPPRPVSSRPSRPTTRRRSTPGTRCARGPVRTA
jgi:PAS domain-containing protein